MFRARYLPLLLATACVESSEPNVLNVTSAAPSWSSPSSTVAWPNEVNFIGAGDIAACFNIGDEATSKLLDTLPGTVFTAGDNAYTEGTASQFANCYFRNALRAVHSVARLCVADFVGIPGDRLCVRWGDGSHCSGRRYKCAGSMPHG